MPLISAAAPGKIILLGEHAVVYGRPAIAIPAHQAQARVTASADIRAPRGRITIVSPEIHLNAQRAQLPKDHPLGLAVDGTLAALGLTTAPALTLTIRSTIPVASGMGSGAAVSVALIRALSAFLGQTLPDEQVNALAYRVEQRLHGTPSGIDNTVVTYARPIYFQRESGFERLTVGAELHFIIADTGSPSSTREAVAGVRKDWQADQPRSEGLFDEIGAIVLQARAAIEQGDTPTLGRLMNADHHCLQALRVSSPALDRLANAARAAGALGAKLSGGGRGGILVALTTPERAVAVAEALTAAGARQVFSTQLERTAQEVG